MAVLGVEFGSTRIKGVLIDRTGSVSASGAYDWENRFEDGVWTYHLEDVWTGLASVVAQVKDLAPDEIIEAVGISAMMHGYLAFDKDDKLLAPFRTWRNTMTGEAAAALSEAFSFNVPQRWCAAHLYQAILNDEAHVPHIAHITTLAGYVHYMLTGERCLGIGDASGAFPLSGESYDAKMMATFEAMAAKKGAALRLNELLPRVAVAGEEAGRLTEKGAALLDPSGWIKPGTPLCPPEGDAGTGMVATNSITPLTGNISAGTSIFSMTVLEKPLAGVYPELDIVATPAGNPVAMVHCNNCTADLDAWIGLFGELLEAAGSKMDRTQLYATLYGMALDAQPDAGGLLSYNYLSGEHITRLEAGVPLFIRPSESSLTLGNFMRSLLFSSVATLKLGMDILTGKEHVKLNYMNGHGGLFKTKRVGQKILVNALGIPIKVSETAGEGGAWGVAVLAGYLMWRAEGESLSEYLDARIFADQVSSSEAPDETGSEGFAAYIENYVKGLNAERIAAKLFS